MVTWVFTLLAGSILHVLYQTFLTHWDCRRNLHLRHENFDKFVMISTSTDGWITARPSTSKSSRIFQNFHVEGDERAHTLSGWNVYFHQRLCLVETENCVNEIVAERWTDPPRHRPHQTRESLENDSFNTSGRVSKCLNRLLANTCNAL